MTIFLRVVFIFLCVSFSISTVNAGSCSSLVKKIQRNIHDKSPLQLTLTDLQSSLGETHPDTSTDGMSTYKWNCPENSGITLSVITTADGRITKLSGIYTDENNAEAFSTAMNAEAAPAAAPPQPVATSVAQATPTVNNKPATSNSKCQEFIERIIKDNKSGDPFDRNKFSWINLDVLKENLGAPRVNEVTYTLSIWDSYAVYAGGGTTMAQGQRPEGLPVGPSVEEVSRVLGQPKSSESEIIYHYTWDCPNIGSFTANIDKQGKITDMNLQTTMNNTFGFISLSGLQKSELLSKLDSAANQMLNQRTTPAETKPVADAASAEKIKNYNTFFKTSFTDPGQIEADSITRAKAYYAAIRNCTPGTYLSFNMIGYETAVIKGKENDLCIVDRTMTLSGEPATGMPVTCKYKPASLVLFTEKDAENAGSGKFSFNGQLTPLQKAEQDDCKR